jgi:hypothetical protein
VHDWIQYRIVFFVVHIISRNDFPFSLSDENNFFIPFICTFRKAYIPAIGFMVDRSLKREVGSFVIAFHAQKVERNEKIVKFMEIPEKLFEQMKNV